MSIEISRQAINRAEQLREALEALKYIFFVRPQSNQQLSALKSYATFSVWDAVGTNHTIIRLATSWTTTEEDVTQLIKASYQICQTNWFSTNKKYKLVNWKQNIL